MEDTAAIDDDDELYSRVEFWTTPDVRDRFLRIVSTIGGPKEKKRARALFFDDPSVPESLSLAPIENLEDATQAFWEETRHEACRVNAVPVRVFEDDSASLFGAAAESTSRPAGSTDFWLAMQQTCLRLLADEPVPHPRSLLDSSLPVVRGIGANSDMERAVVTKSNPKLTAHTVASFLSGASQRAQP